MAIKGKKRTRGRPRAVAHAPRPFLVPPKTPLLRRRSVQIFLIVLVEGLIALLGWGLRQAQDARELEDEVSRFGAQVESTLGSTGVATPLPDGRPLVLAEMGQALGALQQEGGHRDLSTEAKGWAKQAEEAAQALAALTPERAELQLARNQMVQGLRMYAVVARTLEVAGGAEGDVVQDLLPSMQQQLVLGAELFDSGWRSLQDARTEAGIAQPSGGQMPGLPPGLQPGLPIQP